MTREEAIKQLQGMVVGAEWLSDYMVVALEMAIEALKQQIPMKVKAHQNCPICGKDVIGSGFWCWNCGQHLDWEVANETD